jgi:hypothetical protein
LNKKLFNNSMNFQTGSNVFSLDVSKLNAGMYFLVISNGDKNFVGKIVVQ